MEAIDGGDVREDACGDFQRNPCFRQLGAEDLGTQWSLRVVTVVQSRFFCECGCPREAVMPLLSLISLPFLQCGSNNL